MKHFQSVISNLFFININGMLDKVVSLNFLKMISSNQKINLNNLDIEEAFVVIKKGMNAFYFDFDGGVLFKTKSIIACEDNYFYKGMVNEYFSKHDKKNSKLKYFRNIINKVNYDYSKIDNSIRIDTGHINMIFLYYNFNNNMYHVVFDQDKIESFEEIESVLEKELIEKQIPKLEISNQKSNNSKNRI